LPVTTQSGQRLTHEEVINKLDDETVSYATTFGFNGQLSENLNIYIKVETKLYHVAVAWLHDLLYRSEFDKER
jgi:Zn-dependent M16 (insulinase) family peptidase